jgi:DNA-binding winged helix-turn-helix (wHTH) protein
MARLRADGRRADFKLRKKLEADPKKPKLLKSVHGDGYVFTASVSRQGAPKN